MQTHGAVQEDRSKFLTPWRWVTGVAIIVVGVAATNAAFESAYGYLAIGLMEVTTVLLIATFCRKARTRRILGAVLTLLMLLGALGSFTTFSNFAMLPDPFGATPIPANADIMCGTVQRPSHDTGSLGGGLSTADVCTEWLDDRRFEVRAFLVLAVLAAAATAADGSLSRRRRATAHAG